MTRKKTRTGVYGGTFNPVHSGHVAAAAAFVEQMALDELLIIPTYMPPHKEAYPADEPYHRLKMCKLAFAGIERAVVSDMEIVRGGRSYTVDTLRALSAPGRELFLLCGSDMMLSFDTWRDFEKIFRLCQPVYVRRENDPEVARTIAEKNVEYQRKYGNSFIELKSEPIVISSLEIREKIRRGEDVSDYLPPDVAKYIYENRLYVR
ncbi:MAG: nicotinate (nicotinamide) nucleotide adenylyltransferase [Clostridiales bacterium]|mgnify:CR=1 FL=1|jgi:nicotinate-nucleotide adenylyltransferase|nr:nicotinate (nicotinamide) nucleotide adenylyltransferase [Clostridiales bacterium]HOA84601.1 nicotinate (nicotinamide) nucleotide adenylyltransferase [Bacillota bacterium]